MTVRMGSVRVEQRYSAKSLVVGASDWLTMIPRTITGKGSLDSLGRQSEITLKEIDDRQAPDEMPDRIPQAVGLRSGARRKESPSRSRPPGTRPP